MHFLTELQCQEWLSGRNRRLPTADTVAHSTRLSYPPEPHRIRHYSRAIATSIPYRDVALLWITEWGIWGSTENWHLYYRLRQTYGDFRQLHEAPGHLFLDYEGEDLASFLQLAMLNGWGGYVLTHLNFVNVFFSHDEFIDIFANQESEVNDLIKAIAPSPAKPDQPTESP